MRELKGLDANVYVVGYPKSGNTWLVRLLARCLDTAVEKTPMGGEGVDIASAVNAQIEGGSEAKIFKVHWLPAEFSDQIDSAPKYIVYVCRDPRDVLISSFFYFAYSGDEKYVTKRGPSGLVPRLRHLRGRRCFSRYLDGFLKAGVGTLGTWADHVTAWKTYLDGREEAVRSTFVRYEDLLSDTVGELQRIMGEMRLAEREPEMLRAIVQEESIGRLQRDSGKMFEALGSFDERYFKRFFRKGQSGDWVGYLASRQLDRIEGKFGSVMKQLGYMTGEL